MFDLEGNPELETLEGVPDDYKGFYEEKDGKYALCGDEQSVGARKLVTGLDKALNASRTEASNYKKRVVDLAPLSEYGDSPSTIAEAFNDRVKEIESAAASGKVDVDRVKESMEKAHAKKLEPYSQRIASLSAQLETLLVKNVAAEAVNAAKGSSKLLMPHIERQVKCVEEQNSEGKPVFKVYVVGDDGEKRFSGVAGAEYMTIAELVGEMKADTDYGRMFNSEAPRGGGAPAGPTRPIPPKGEKKTALDKISSGMQNQDYYRGGRKVSDR